MLTLSALAHTASLIKSQITKTAALPATESTKERLHWLYVNYAHNTKETNKIIYKINLLATLMNEALDMIDVNDQDASLAHINIAFATACDKMIKQLSGE